MKTSIRTITREFTPKEAAAVTGVSPTLQRDWRRRGLLPEKKEVGWTSFTLEDVIQMSVMKAFADSGISVKAAREFSDLAVLPTLAFIDDMPNAKVIEGDELSPKLRETILGSGITRNAHGRFLFAPLPPVGDGDPMHPSGFGAMRGNDPADVNKFMEKHGRFAGVTINLEFLAHLIATKAGLPLIRMVANSEADD